jgi:predicted transcriptional regulator YdeE
VVFHRKGTMPGVVQDTWQEIWDAFDAPEAPFQRAHLVDYEEYPSDQEVRIYVSVRG